jgi:transposase InsO family protein
MMRIRLGPPEQPSDAQLGRATAPPEADIRPYNTSDERAAELPKWLHRYNWHRPHGSIGSMPPISKLGLAGNNLLRLHTTRMS